MNICLFASGSSNIGAEYVDAGYTLGRLIAEHGHTLVFGGGDTGLMGAVANGVYDNGGKITAIYPVWMSEFEGMFTNCDEHVVTENMADRKIRFMEYADCVLVIPGGIGTLDEFFEILTLKKLKVHDLPIIIFNMNHFYDRMLDMLNEMIDEGFIRSDDNNLFVVTTSIGETVEYLI